jgi:hypothetical protein
MANAEKLLRALLAKAYKKQDTEIDQLLAENTDDTQGTTTITEWDAARVSELQKPKPGTTFQDGYAKAKKDERAAFEKEIREKYGIEADAQGLELIDALLAAKAPGKGGPLDDEKVRAHPVYQALEQSKKKELKRWRTNTRRKFKNWKAVLIKKKPLELWPERSLKEGIS